MKKTNLILGTAVTLAVTGALAAPFTVRQAPGRAEATEHAGAMRQAPARIINDEKEMGTYMFASTSIDAQHERAFVDFYSSQPHKLHKLANVWDTSNTLDNLLYISYAGAHTPSGYYAMLAQVFSIGTYAYGWIKVDPATGKYEELAHLRDDATFDWEGSVDYAYNPGDGKLYGLAADMKYDPEKEAVRSRVGTVDMENGRFTETKRLPYYYFALAFDYDGVPYGIRWKIDLDKSDQPLGAYLTRFTKTWAIDKEFELKPEGSDFKVYYMGTMDFDYTTGDLYWAGMNLDARQYLFKINPDNGDIEKLGGVGYSESIAGLYVPFQTADHREAPARVKGLAWEASADGSNVATLKWTNPDKAWNRTSLTDLGDVEIYRNDLMAPIAVVKDAAPGQPSQYVDEKAPQGLHTYYVIPTNAKGLGVMDSIRAYVGRDVPGKVENLSVVTANKGASVNVVWKKPSSGSREGWYDASSMTYSVTRMPDNKVLASGLTKTMFKDEDIDIVERYTYVVTASNADGEGTPTESAEILAGMYMPVPYTTDFENSTDAKRWTVIDRNNDGTAFEYCDFDWPNVGRCYRHMLSAYGSQDDDLVSPPLNMEAGKTYKVTFHVNFHDVAIPHKLNLKGGTDFETLAPFASFDYITHESHYDTSDTFTGFYTAAETGTNYIAFNLASEKAVQEAVRVFGFEVEEEYANDLKALDFTAPLELVAEKTTPVTVKVWNNGSQTQSEYEVQLCCGNNIVIGSTKDVPALQTRTGADVKFHIQASDKIFGLQDVYARTVLAGDERTANDCSDSKEIEFLDKNKIEINHTAKGEGEQLNTRLPMAHYWDYSLTQSIYNPKELGLHGTGTYTVSRLGWEYTMEPYDEKDAPKHEINGTSVRVALGQISNEGFNSVGSSWASAREEYFTGMVSFREGKHYLVLDLKKDFQLDASKSLVVTVYKNNASSVGDWGPQFTCCTEDWNLPVFRSILAQGSTPYGLYDSPKGTVFPNAPHLFLAIKELSSVCEKPMFEGAVSYDAQARAIRLLGLDARNIAVYDMTGAAVAGAALDGEDFFALNVAQGIYLVRVEMADGNVATAKIIVR